MLGFGDESVAVRYRSLGGCAPGTLGRALYDHFVDNDFRFPGEAGSHRIVFHDVGHVLSGYPTDPQGEIQQAAFQAGFARRDGFSSSCSGSCSFTSARASLRWPKGTAKLFDVELVLNALRRRRRL